MPSSKWVLATEEKFYSLDDLAKKHRDLKLVANLSFAMSRGFVAKADETVVAASGMERFIKNKDSVVVTLACRLATPKELPDPRVGKMADDELVVPMPDLSKLRSSQSTLLWRVRMGLREEVKAADGDVCMDPPAMRLSVEDRGELPALRENVVFILTPRIGAPGDRKEDEVSSVPLNLTLEPETYLLEDVLLEPEKLVMVAQVRIVAAEEFKLAADEVEIQAAGAGDYCDKPLAVKIAVSLRIQAKRKRFCTLSLSNDVPGFKVSNTAIITTNLDWKEFGDIPANSALTVRLRAGLPESRGDDEVGVRTPSMRFMMPRRDEVQLMLRAAIKPRLELARDVPYEKIVYPRNLAGFAARTRHYRDCQCIIQ